MTAIRPGLLNRALRPLRGDGLAAHLVKGVAGTGALGLVSKALSLLGAIVLARSLGAEGYGYYAFALAAVGFIAIPAQLGLPQLVLREVAASHARSEWALLEGLRRRALQIAAASTIFGAVLGGGGLLLLADHIAALDPLTFAIALLLLPMQIGLALTGSILCGLRRVVQGTWPRNALQPALFVLLAFLMAKSLTSDLAVTLNVMATAVGLAVTMWMLARYWPREASEATPDYRTRDWMRSMWPFTLLAGISLFNQKTSIMMLGVLASAEDVGVYNVASQGAMLVSFPLVACNAVLAPNVARLYAQGDHQKLQRLITTSTLVISLAAAVAALVLLVAGRWLLAALFGEAFADAYPALSILAIGQLLNACAGSVVLFLSMTGHEKDTLKGMSVAALLNLILNALLIPSWDFVGAAVATAVSLVTWNILLGVLLYRRLGLIAGPFGGWLAGPQSK